MRWVRCLLITLLLLSLGQTAVARERVVEYTPSGILIRATVGETTQVVFPSDVRVEGGKVIFGVSPKKVSTASIRNNFFIKPLQEIRKGGDLYVVVQPGDRVVHFLIKTVPGKERDSVVRVVFPVRKIVREMKRFREVSPLKFLKSIVWGPVIPGITAEDIRPPKVVFDNGKFTLTLLRKYVSPKYVAYVVRETNVAGERLYVPIERIYFPGLLLIKADKVYLNSGDYDILVFVADRSLSGWE